ncbi:MAG: hypothetical protein AAFP04_00060 [Myxococcota bacterium]
MSREDEHGCLDEGQLLSYIDGALSQAEMDEVERRLVHCSQSRALLKELRRPLSPELIEAGFAVFPKHRRSASVRWTGGMAALATAVAAMAILVLRPAETSLPEYRLEGPEGGVTRQRGMDTPSFYSEDSELRVRLRPLETSNAEPRASAWTYSEVDDRWTRQSDAFFDRGPSGGFRFVAPARILATGEGLNPVWFGITRDTIDRDQLTTSELQVLRDGGQWFRIDFEYRQEPL